MRSVTGFAKFTFITVVFVFLGFIERVVTSSPATEELTEYRQHFEEYNKKGFLTAAELEQLQVKQAEVDNLWRESEQSGHSANSKLRFGAIVLLVSFLSCTIVLKKPSRLQAGLVCCICAFAMFWFVSKVDFAFYVLCCGVGVIIAMVLGTSRKNEI